MIPLFRDRVEAGQQLAAQLEHYARRDDVILLALPPGGVAVGFEVACRLHVPMDVLVVRTLVVSRFEPVAFGAIAQDGVEVLEPSIVTALNLSPAAIQRIAGEERTKLEWCEYAHRLREPLPPLQDMIVVLVDDGISMASRIRAALEVARRRGARAVVVASPVASCDVVASLRREADAVVALVMPHLMTPISAFYGDFSPPGDDEIRSLVVRANARLGIKGGTAASTGLR